MKVDMGKWNKTNNSKYCDLKNTEAHRNTQEISRGIYTQTTRACTQCNFSEARAWYFYFTFVYISFYNVYVLCCENLNTWLLLIIP